MNLSVRFYDKVSAVINNLTIIDIGDSLTNDSINIYNEFIKNEDYIKRDKIKNVCITDIIEIPIMKNMALILWETKIYLAVIKLNVLFLSKHNGEKFCINYFWNS